MTAKNNNGVINAVYKEGVVKSKQTDKSMTPLAQGGERGEERDTVVVDR